MKEMKARSSRAKTNGNAVLKSLQIAAVAFLTFCAHTTMGAALGVIPGWPVDGNGVATGFQPGRHSSGQPFDRFYSSPAVSSSGIIYIAGFLDTAANDDGSGLVENHLYAINPGAGSGPSVLWRGSLGSPYADEFFHGTESSPAIGPDGTIYIGTADDRLRAFNPTDGSIKWTYPPMSGEPLVGPIRSAPIVVPDPTTANAFLIYTMVQIDLQGQGTRVYLQILRESAGLVSWVGEWPPGNIIEPSGRAISSPALGRNGMLYFGIADISPRYNSQDVGSRGWLYAINVSDPANPTKSWQYPAANAQPAEEVGAIVGSPAIGADGTIYVPTQWHIAATGGGVDKSGSLLALDASGNFKWKYETNDPDIVPVGTFFGAIDSSPAIDRDGTIYVGVDEPVNALVALNPITHQKDWFFKESGNSGPFEAGPVVGPDGKVYVRAITPHSTLYGLINNGASVTLDTKNILDTENLGPNSDHALTETPFSSLAMTADGRIYSASGVTEFDAGRIWGFQTGSSGTPFWAKFRGNNSNTGSVEDNKWTTNTTIVASITKLATGLNNPYAVNNVDKAAGMQSSGTAYRACYWNAAQGTSANLPTAMTALNTSYTSYVNGMNDKNQAVGNQQIDSSGALRAIYWPTLAATPTLLQMPLGSTRAEAFEISVNGMIAGYMRSSTGVERATQWDANSPNAQGLALGALGTLSTLNSYGYGVNSRRWIIGASQSGSDGVYHAFAAPPRLQPGIVGGSDNLRPNDVSYAHAINGVLQIVGGSANGTTGEHAWLWQKNGEPSLSIVASKDLGVLTGGATSRALAINNRGHVVGWSYVSGTATTAFIWIPGWPTMKNLRSFLSASDQATWTELTIATGITDDGTVVGYGKRYDSPYSTGFAIKPK